MRWLIMMATKHPETLLSLLIRAQQIHRDGLDVPAIFRAGILVGAAHPYLATERATDLDMEYARRVLELMAPPAGRSRTSLRLRARRVPAEPVERTAPPAGM